MKRFISILKKDARHIKPAVSRSIRSFSYIERVVFFSVLWIFILSTLVLCNDTSNRFMVEIPKNGGTIHEGIVGVPRFINPLLAVNDADRDLTALVYSGLMRVDNNGHLIPDLAQKYEISEDGKTYTFTLKENLFFHDGGKLSADDIVFTIQKAQDPALKSPKRASWEGVSVEKIDERTVVFTLQKAYAPFLENTNLGILPAHIWRDANADEFNFSQFNTEPIGSGPYRIENIQRNSLGIPRHYELIPFKKFALGKAYIKHVDISLFENETKLEEALKKGEIDNISTVSPKAARALTEEDYTVRTTSLPRVFGIFFNQNQSPLFADIVVRKALNYAIDKEKIVDTVLSGYASVIDGPIPPGSLGYREPEMEGVLADERAEPEPSGVEKALSILEKNGWSKNEESGIMEKKSKKETTILSFSLSTSNVPELKEAAQLIKEDLAQIGAEVEIKVFDTSDLNQNVIRPRKYDALLFGEIIGRESDLFAFWHSSQRNDPGLNIAQYANISADKLLEDARGNSDINARIETYEKFQEEIVVDVPAIFLYSPNFIYIIPDSVKGVDITSVSVPSDRFAQVYSWFIETDRVWNIFDK